MIPDPMATLSQKYRANTSLLRHKNNYDYQTFYGPNNVYKCVCAHVCVCVCVCVYVCVCVCGCVGVFVCVGVGGG